LEKGQETRNETRKQKDRQTKQKRCRNFAEYVPINNSKTNHQAPTS